MANMKQYTDAILIIRVNQDGTRRTVGTAHSQATADQSCISLARAFYNLNNGCEYVTERNPKYRFDDALRVVGLATDGLNEVIADKLIARMLEVA